MRKLQSDTCFIILTCFVLTCSCDENNEEETNPGIEYMQIFRNIPTLFEYFLDVLQQRVEILERDDVSMFQDPSGCSEDGEKKNTKREVDQCNLNSKVNTYMDGNENLELAYNNQGANKFKRQDVQSIDDTTEKHEYGHSIAQQPNPNKKSLNDNKDIVSGRIKRENFKDKYINRPLDKYLAELNKQKGKNRKDNCNNDRGKRENKELKNDFAKIDWTLFYLSPEEVEEKAIKTEQTIEKHNRKDKEN